MPYCNKIGALAALLTTLSVPAFADGIQGKRGEHGPSPLTAQESRHAHTYHPCVYIEHATLPCEYYQSSGTVRHHTVRTHAPRRTYRHVTTNTHHGQRETGVKLADMGSFTGGVGYDIHGGFYGGGGRAFHHASHGGSYVLSHRAAHYSFTGHGGCGC